MRWPTVFVLAVLVAVAAALPAQAHTPGATPVDKAGSFVLTPVGTDNSSVHEYLTSFGLPIGANDTLEIHFIVNGGRGPAIDFEIHTHGGTTGYVRYFNVSGSNVTATWKLPFNDSFMVYFVNPNNAAVNVTYNFVLFPPPGDLTPLIVFPLAIGGAIGWFLWLRAGRDVTPEGEDAGGTAGDDWRDPPESKGPEPPPDAKQP